MKKKNLGVFVSLFVVMVVLPMCVTFAEKPTIEMVLMGTFYMNDPEHWVESHPGHNKMYKARDFATIWSGEIECSGVYLGNWLINPKGGQWVEDVKTGNYVMPGSFVLENVSIHDSAIGVSAFVTLTHPESKYEGSGTEGIILRDCIIDVYPP